jgi:ubiquinone/menaquinone biosynthesis C-methylase UbiE
MAMLEYDNEATKRLLAIYTTPDVEEQRNAFINAFEPQLGQRVLDVGSGPGFLSNAIFDKVGQSGSVCGIDISEPLLDIANSQNKKRVGIEFLLGDATKLPFSSEEFDTVVSTQVLEYIPEVDVALIEFHRVLRTGGTVALLDTDWDSIVWHSSNRTRMNRILQAWEEHAADPFLPRTLSKKLNRAGLQVQSEKIIPICNAEFSQETYSNRLIDLIIPFVVNTGNITTNEAEAWAQDLRKCGQNGEYFFSLNRYFFLAKKL